MIKLFPKLPYDIIRLIFDFDNTYHTKYKYVVNQFEKYIKKCPEKLSKHFDFNFNRNWKTCHMCNISFDCICHSKNDFSVLQEPVIYQGKLYHLCGFCLYTNKSYTRKNFKVLLDKENLEIILQEKYLQICRGCRCIKCISQFIAGNYELYKSCKQCRDRAKKIKSK